MPVCYWALRGLSTGARSSCFILLDFSTYMKFDIYGRFQLEIQRQNANWVVYRIELGKRAKLDDIVIPATLEEPQEIAIYLDDLFHELSGPGDSVEVIP